MLKFKLRPRLSATLLVVLFLLIFLHYFKILLPVESLVVKIFSPIQSLVYSFSGKLNFNQETPELKRIRQLIIENEKLKVLTDEYQSLKKQLQILQTQDFQYLIAKVLSRDLTSSWQGLIINVGKNQGVAVGLPVIFENGILIGKIFEAEDNFSKVILLTDNHSQTAATISNLSQTIGVVSGEYGLNLKMELIPKDERIAKNDIVITSGLEPNIPRGLAIGEIAAVDESAGEFFKTAYLKSLVALDKISVVSVLVPRYTN